MNTAQRIVKYLAIGFAVFLIVSIFSGITYGVLGIVTTGKLIGDNSTVEARCESEEKLCLEISLSISNLEIKRGSELSVETKNEKITVSQDEHNLIITEKGRHLFERYYDREVTIYIPEDMEFEKAAISGGAGSIYIENLNAENLEMALGIGQTKIELLETSNAKISTGIGEVSVNLASSAEDYEIKASKGIGELTINGHKVSDHSTTGSGDKKLDVSGGIGSVKITTK